MDLTKFHQCWFAIRVRPRHEFVTAELLRSKGYEDFVPTYRSQRKWSDRTKDVEVPLFTGYVFCRFDVGASWPVVSTHGILEIVGTRSGPVAIPEQEIEAIRKSVASGLNTRPHSYVNIGDRVRILNGVLAGVQGILRRVNNRAELILSVDLIQASVIVNLSQCSTLAGEAITFAR